MFGFNCAIQKLCKIKNINKDKIKSKIVNSFATKLKMRRRRLKQNKITPIWSNKKRRGHFVLL